jgi:hypothetical protein
MARKRDEWHSTGMASKWDGRLSRWVVARFDKCLKRETDGQVVGRRLNGMVG